ncbi:hypothetical protein ES705_23126 [subsurface metagenome]
MKTDLRVSVVTNQFCPFLADGLITQGSPFQAIIPILLLPSFFLFNLFFSLVCRFIFILNFHPNFLNDLYILVSLRDHMHLDILAVF